MKGHFCVRWLNLRKLFPNGTGFSLGDNLFPDFSSTSYNNVILIILLDAFIGKYFACKEIGETLFPKIPIQYR